MPAATDEDTIRILVATDNHVGYEERDAIRKDDSWRTFDEILNLARKEDVDMVLLAGDLFHENKPSRKSMYQVMRSLRKNCLGMKPCQLEFLSDASEVFEGAFTHVNYEDPDMNISIPVFSIHGNHDDPSGDGHFCSLDLLQVAGLVNYFGRVPEADNIKVKPVLFQKGRTKLALFGLSNVRDERMFRTFRDHHVTFFRPTTQQSDFFNLLAVHQNHHAHTATSYLPENVLPEWMDLVVWGHEHECLINPKQNPETGFHVMQPGSSVATSLVPGEAVTKHVAVVSVTGKEFKTRTIPLKTVRPFVTDEIVLATDSRFKGVATKKENRQEITKRLMVVVDELIVKAMREWDELQEVEVEPEEKPLPLVRLKVEYTAPEGGQFDCENPQRFSNRFVGKVANVNDVVYFYRKKTGASRRANANGVQLPDAILNALDEDDVIKVNVLVQEFLAQESLKVLPQNRFTDAVIGFVEKDDKQAMDTLVNDTLAAQLRGLLNMNAEDNNLDDAMMVLKKAQEDRWSKEKKTGTPVARRRLKPKPQDWDSDMDGNWEDQPEAWETGGVAPTIQPAKTNGRGTARATVIADEDEDESGIFMTQDSRPSAAAAAAAAAPRRGAAAKAKTTRAAPASKKAAAKKPPPRGRAKKGGFVDDDSDEEEDIPDEPMDDFDDNDDNQEEDEPAPAPPPKRAAVTRSTRTAPNKTTTTRAKAATTARGAAAANARGQTKLDFSQSQRPAAKSGATTAGGSKTKKGALEISDDEISEDDDDDEDAFESLPSTRSRRR